MPDSTNATKADPYEQRYGKVVDEYLAEIRANFIQKYAPLVANGEWVPRQASVVAMHSATQDLADMVFRGERIKNDSPIR